MIFFSLLKISQLISSSGSCLEFNVSVVGQYPMSCMGFAYPLTVTWGFMFLTATATQWLIRNKYQHGVVGG